MKKKLFTLASFLIITGMMVTGCNTPAEKVTDAQKEVTEANKDLNEANKEYLADMEDYRRETTLKIAANDSTIQVLTTKIATEKKEKREAYQKKINKLEEKNTEMKMKLNNYKAEGKDNWEKFKAEFNHDMEEMGKAFKDLTVNNVK